ncbi:MAG: porin [Alistipes sp.]|jgi:hypothetical protein|nr:porin [Alistipes sp.]
MKTYLKLIAACAALVATTAQAQEQTRQPAITVTPSGTVRAKFEYQPTEGNARYSVRTARFGVGGSVYGTLDYKMEIDLSDEGKIKMVDAYVAGKIYKGLSLSMGFMRVPFTIDAHRSPHLQLFANRSFIAKQVGGTRDVGAVLGWRFGTRVPINIQLGMFNGSGLVDNLQSYWTGSFDYSAKVQAGVAKGLNLVAGYRNAMPHNVRMHLYDAGVTYTTGRWLMEGEYLRKTYAGGEFDAVNSIDAFLSYGVPMGDGALRRVSFLGRYDYLGDHSNGTAVEGGLLTVNDPERHRATAGVTFSLGLPFAADIRLNYEKYFYGINVQPGPSDHDKIVVELMAHF